MDDQLCGCVGYCSFHPWAFCSALGGVWQSDYEVFFWHNSAISAVQEISTPMLADAAGVRSRLLKLFISCTGAVCGWTLSLHHLHFLCSDPRNPPDFGSGQCTPPDLSLDWKGTTASLRLFHVLWQAVHGDVASKPLSS